MCCDVPGRGAARRGHIRDDARPVVPEEPCPADPRGAAETQEERPGDPKRNAGPLTPLGAGVWGPLCPCWGHAGSRPPRPPNAGQRLVRGDPFPHVRLVSPAHGRHRAAPSGRALRVRKALHSRVSEHPSSSSAAPACDPSGPVRGSPPPLVVPGSPGPPWLEPWMDHVRLQDALKGPGAPLRGPGVRRSCSGRPSQPRPAARKTEQPSPSPALHVRASKGRTAALRQAGRTAQPAGQGGLSGVGGG